MNRSVHHAARNAALAAALLASASVLAADPGCVGSPASAGGSRYAAVEPYQLARSQYRLADDGQYQLNGARQAGPARRHAACGPPRASSYAPAYRPAAAGGAYHALINTTARIVGIQADLLHAVIAVESAYDSSAVSRKGA